MIQSDQCADFTGIVSHETLIAIARLIQSTTCVGSPAPVGRRIGDWCRATPEPGDLVVEMSSRLQNPDRVGLFERFEERRVCNHERIDVDHPGCTEPDCLEWKAEDGRPERFVWILVQREPERRCRWHNANFLRLPNGERQLNQALTYGLSKDQINRPGYWQPGAGPMSIDRAGLVAILADSGIEIKSKP